MRIHSLKVFRNEEWQLSLLSHPILSRAVYSLLVWCHNCKGTQGTFTKILLHFFQDCLHVTHYFITFVKGLCISTSFWVLAIHGYLITIWIKLIIVTMLLQIVKKANNSNCFFNRTECNLSKNDGKQKFNSSNFVNFVVQCSLKYKQLKYHY